MKLSPICWAAAFSAALPCRRALRRGPSAGKGAVPGGGTGGGGGGGAVVVTLGGLARGGRGRGEFLELRAPNLPIAFSYEHFSDSPYRRDRTTARGFTGFFLRGSSIAPFGSVLAWLFALGRVLT